MDRPISRRGFLKGIMGTAIGGSLVGRPVRALAANLSKRPDHYAILSDLTRCIGCRRCEAACNKANNLPPPEVPFDDRSVVAEERRPDVGAYTVVNRYEDPKTGQPVYVKRQCMHCEEPACASACIVGALKKTPEGPVIWDGDVCIGCRYCMSACPFYIPAFEYFNPTSPRIEKCFMCYQRLSEGELPACVAECPMEALTFGRRSELIELARERIRKNPDKYIDHIYGEHEAGGTDWLYVSGVPFEKLGFPTDLLTTSYPKLTYGFLSLVPVILVAWPALFGGIYLMSKGREEDSERKTTSVESEKEER
ncbi:MAG: 4Fe-4S dicluster domain-containing protein [Candidatus Bipolaricaulia bacterium]